MKGWSVGFPTTLQLFKTRERQLWGQLTAGSGISKHGEDGVTSKTNPAHTIPLQEMKRRKKKGERRRAGWTVTTSKSLRSFVNVFFFGVLCLFGYRSTCPVVSYCLWRVMLSKRQSLIWKHRCLTGNQINVATPCLPSQNCGFILCWIREKRTRRRWWTAHDHCE